MQTDIANERFVHAEPLVDLLQFSLLRVGVGVAVK